MVGDGPPPRRLSLDAFLAVQLTSLVARARSMTMALRPAPPVQLCGARQRHHDLAARPRAAARSSTVDAQTLDDADAVPSSRVPLACPICLRPFRGAECLCAACARSFPQRGPYTDLTLTSSGAGSFKESAPPQSTSLFQNPLISYAYERGWRRSFSWAGFPGEEVEFKQAQQWLRPASGGVLLDASCGSGLFTRRFAASSDYAAVIGLDFSAAMLLEADERMRASLPSSTPVTLIRADVARLPFATGSIDAVHAGAALHCWPAPGAAMAEISRVLKPGGVFVASTFLDPTAPLGEVIGDAVVLPFAQALGAQQSSSYRWWNETELRDLCTMVGLTGVERIRSRQFIIFKASKPGRVI